MVDTKPQLDAKDKIIVALIAILAALSTIMLILSANCSVDLNDLFENRTDEQFTYQTHLANRLTYFVDRNKALIQGSESQANGLQQAGLDEKRFSYGPELAINSLNQKIEDKKTRCNIYSAINQIFIAAMLILSIYQLIIAMYYFRRTTWPPEPPTT